MKRMRINIKDSETDAYPSSINVLDDGWRRAGSGVIVADR